MKRNGRLEFDDLAKSSFQSLYVPVEINNINLEMITDTDANLSGISGILSQEQENSEKVISFASHTLNKGQRNYCVTKHELLAVVTFVRQFRHFLWGRKFIIRTDHASLTWLRNFKVAEGMIAQRISILDNFNFEIQHRKCSLETIISTVTDTSQGPSSEPNWLDFWSKQEIKIMQENDPSIGEI
jgi:hypothetical protein